MSKGGTGWEYLAFDESQSGLYRWTDAANIDKHASSRGEILAGMILYGTVYNQAVSGLRNANPPAIDAILSDLNSLLEGNETPLTTADWNNLAHTADVINGFIAEDAEINLVGNGISIPNEDFTPSLVDNTDFGEVSTDSVAVATFVIENNGTRNLNLTGPTVIEILGANTLDFTVSALPLTSIVAGDTTSFEVSFAPSSTGNRSAIVRIFNNDWNESPYIFKLQGTGIDPIPPSHTTLNIMTMGEGEVNSLNDNTIQCGTTCQSAYLLDSEVTLIATAVTGHVFLGWSGDCTETTETVTVVMDNDKICFANFVPSEANDFQVAVQKMISSFYELGTLWFQDATDGNNISDAYPSQDNYDRLQEAFQYVLPAILMLDLQAPTWPAQLNDISWYQTLPVSAYTESVKIMSSDENTAEHIQIRVNLWLMPDAVEESVEIRIIYGESTTPPVNFTEPLIIFDRNAFDPWN
jgi:uncharacterized repeat protein (TIGR02543 family)